MPQFKPADREAVREKAESMGAVQETAETHAGLMMKLADSVEVDCIGGLFNSHGWVIDTVNFDTRTVSVVPAGQPEVNEA